MATDDVRESRMIVRMYSFDVEERLPPGSDAHVLGQVLAEDRGDFQSLTAPWRKFFEPWEDNRNPLTEVITVESTKLRKKWVVFQDNCPTEERLDLQNSEPTVEGVVDMVKETVKAWQTRREKGRRGKAMSLFHKFSRSLNSHSALIKLLPEGNEYVSVFTGTLNAVIKASVNHERIAEGLSEALCLISEPIIWCKVELELFKTMAMLELVADLYSHIFLFLSGTMDWIMEKRYKRMLDSFNENFKKRFDDEIANIRHKAERIQKLAAQSSRAELRATRLTVEELGRDIRIGLEGDARYRAELSHLAERMEKELLEAGKEREQMRRERWQLAVYLKHMLQEGAVRSLQAKHTSYIPIELFSMPESPFDTAQPAQATQWTSEDVSLNSRDLEDFFHRDRVRLSRDRLNSVMVNEETLTRLSEWTEMTNLQILWLEGSHTEADDFENPVAVIAAKFVDLADKSQMPVISYFCELRRNEPLRPDNTREVQAMISLAYALLRQMIELLLPRFDANIDLSESRFRGLDGTVESWVDALSIFRDLLDLAPDTVFCVIDGIQWLDDKSTDNYLKDLLQVFRCNKLKVLLTTIGRSACLREELSASETLQVDMLRLRDADLEMDRHEFWTGT